MGIVPSFQISVDGERIDGIVDLRVVDEEGLFSDSVMIEISDDGKLAIPRLGAKIEVELGYEGELSKFGEYVVDECEISNEGKMSLRCNAMDFGNMLRKIHTRTFPKENSGVKLEEIVKEVAKEYGMKVALDEYAKAVSFRLVHQRNESDLHFLTRLCQDRSCVLKIKENVVCILGKGGETASGKKLPEVEFKENLSSWRYSLRKCEEFKSVSAIWRAMDEAKENTVVVGDGEPCFGIPYRFRTENDAKQAATAKLKNLKKAVETFECEVVGDTKFRAEVFANISGIRKAVDGRWIIKRAEHRISRSGYTVAVKCEKSE